jgi:hypothetical protein
MFGDSIEINFEAFASSSSSNSSKSNNNNASNSNLFDDSDCGRRSYHEEVNFSGSSVGDNNSSNVDMMTYEVNYRGLDIDVDAGVSHMFTFVAPLTTEVSSSRCAEMLSTSAFSSNHDAIYERMDVPLDTYSLRSPLKTVVSPCFAPGTLASLTGSAKAVPPQPPLVPAVTLNTIFTCAHSKPLDEIVQTVNSVFDYMGDNMSAQFSANEFMWHCNFISEGHQHVNFLVKIYRYSKRHELYGSFAVEFQRLEGDRLPYMNAYNACRDLLTTTDFGDAYDYFSQSFYGQDSGNVGFSSVLDCSASFGSLPMAVPPSSSSASSSNAEEQSKNILKDSIVKQLSVQATYNNLLENIQMISSLYASTAASIAAVASPSKPGNASAISPVDTELFLALCDVARKYSSNSRDWVYQHSIIAIADMLALFDKCGCCSGLMSQLQGQESVVALLRSMAGFKDDNCFVSSKSEQISKMISLLH